MISKNTTIKQHSVQPNCQFSALFVISNRLFSSEQKPRNPRNCSIFEKSLHRRFTYLTLKLPFKLVYYCVIFFFYLSFLSQTFTIHRTAGEGEGICLTPLYHFHPLHRHLDIRRAISIESSHLQIGSSRTRIRNLSFSNASR